MRHLLSAYSFIPHRIATAASTNNRFPMEEMLRRQMTVARTMREFRPDVVLSLMGSYTQSATLFRVPNVVFTDSEFQSFNHHIAHPFATRIYTPDCFYKDLGRKQRRYRGYHELAFLHPSRFAPRRDVLSYMGGVEPFEYVIVRTSAWNTLHDVGEHGFGRLFRRFMELVEPRIKVFVVPEGRLPAEYEDRRLRIPPDYFHDALAFARLVVTEGASTASEAACLGVPAVFVNSTDRGYLNDQERRYGLVHNYREPAAALERTLTLLDAPPSREQLAEVRDRLIRDHIDVTAFVVDEVDAMRKPG
jgi:predicted glycosyltransferase